MSTGPLARQADIRKLASLGALLEGAVKVAELARLRQAVAAENGGVVEYCLRFGVTEEGILSIEGKLNATVVLLCQRCLEPMEYPLASEFLLGVAFGDDRARQLPRRLEPLVLEEDDDSVDLVALVEDEALLCLPIVSYHPQDQCKRKAGYSSVEGDAEPTVETRSNPFDVLAQLKKPES